MTAALVIFLITYALIGIRQIPRIHIDRPAGALVGAVLTIVFGVLTLEQAFAAIDMHTLLLLLGMMIITVYLRAAGFFELMADRILSLSRTPFQLLILVAVSSGVLSALFVNDTICLLYTPIILAVAGQLRVNPVPYLLALATSSNIGSVMTVTGNPQNMLIGIHSGIPYLAFLGALFPVAAAGLAICVLVIRRLYRSEMGAGAFASRPELPAYVVRKGLLSVSLLVSAGVLVAFSLGYPYSLSAAAGGVALLIVGGVRTERILEGVDWTLLLFFAGLFIVMRGVESSGLAAAAISRAGDMTALAPAGAAAGLSLVSAVLSNLVSNVPAVMLLKPLTESLGGGPIPWLALAMSSTLAGNLTLIGSVANLIVVQQARKQVDIGFWEYFRAGAIITVLTIATGIAVLAAEIRIAESAPSSRRDGVVTVEPTARTGAARSFRIVLECDTEESRRQGLQGFRRLERDEAALFVFDRPQVLTFWMGTVAYPIDIIFVDAAGKVITVHANLPPGSTELYASTGPAARVVETAAGSGIRVGDRVRFR